MKKTLLFLTVLSLLSAADCGRKPEKITIQKEDLFPEGVVYDTKRGRYLVSSLKFGMVGAVSDAGVYTPFIESDKLISAIGLHIDAARDRLIVCSSDPGPSVKSSKETKGKLAGLGIYNLADGKEIFFANLAAGDKKGGHFANDSTVDKDGNIYVTDSFSPVIYKITPDFKYSEFIRDDRWKGEGFHLNGIDFIGDSIIVADSDSGKLYKIPVADPKGITEVKLDKALKSADGLTKISDTEIVVVTNSESPNVHFLKSTDGWASAAESKTVTKDWVFPTTADLRDGDVYVLSAKLSSLFSGKGEKQFEIYNVSKDH